jgi:hypothetical protein
MLCRQGHERDRQDGQGHQRLQQLAGGIEHADIAVAHAGNVVLLTSTEYPSW